MEAKIKEYITEHNIELIREQLKEINCNHKWWDHGSGLGYRCKECGYYTGLDDTLNKLIKKLLTTKKK